ncbi:MAG TPA: hypothetical protein VL096_17915 [Pirellulaceae bacterium]|nr:hypothetical protein [Pirellulaceae bacterium]
MAVTLETPGASLRRSIYALLIVAACAAAAGRILTVASDDGKTPFLSANDRSRWSTIRALVDEGTFELDKVILRPDGKRDKHWYSIDLVRHRGWDGREHYYSSKPTLTTVLLAGEYWIVQRVLGTTLEEHPLYVGRAMLLLTNIVPLAIYLWLLSRLIERYGSTDWGRLLVLACAAFGTFITTFSVTLNNHTLAAVTALATVYLVLSLWQQATPAWWRFVAAGLLAALTVANELPALAMLALLALALLYKSPLKTCLGFAPAVMLIAAAAVGTNYWAHGSWKTPYAHRKDGAEIAMVHEEVRDELDAGILPWELLAPLAQADYPFSGYAQITVKTPGERWMYWDDREQLRLAIVSVTDAEQPGLSIRAWDNWYDYEGTYWNDENKRGVDRGEPSRWVYAFHCLFGHHGLFSLTPIWLGSVLGLWMLWRKPEIELRGFALMTLVLTVVVLSFYIVQRPLEDRNYGGVSSGLRWMFWFTPLWLIALVPAADWFSATRSRRAIALVAFAVSVLSAHYASLNPWSPPWLFDYWTYLGWLNYGS